MFGNLRPYVLLLFGAVGLVLLIASRIALHSPPSIWLCSATANAAIWPRVTFGVGQ